MSQAKRAVEYDKNRIVVGGAGSCIRGRPVGSLPGFLQQGQVKGDFGSQVEM